MNEKRFQKQQRQLQLAQQAMALQSMFGPEQEARERLAAEQGRAAFYANEVLRREQQRLAEEAPLRQRQLLAETAMKEDAARNFAARQALQDTAVAQENAARAAELDFGNKTTEQRMREAAARVQAAEAAARNADVEARFAAETYGPRLGAAQLQPQLANVELDARRAQLGGMRTEQRVAEERLRQSRGLYPAQRLTGDIQAMEAAKNFSLRAGPMVEVKDAKGNAAMMPSPVDPSVLLQSPEYDAYRQMMQRFSQSSPQQTVAALPPQIATTVQTLSDPLLAQGFFASEPQRRAYSQSQVPGTVNRGTELAALLQTMQANPTLEWPESALAVQAIARDPYSYGMAEFDPSLIEPNDFALALAYIRQQRQQLPR